MTTAVVRGMTDADADQVIALWHLAGVARPWNDPVRDISFARRGEHSTVLVAELHGRIAATAMVGEDGHRGWVCYVASDPERRGVGLGRFVMEASERWLAARGIWKVQLLVRADNAAAQAFYERLGYADAGSTCFQKMLRHAQADDVPLPLQSFTIYHSPNAYLGTVLLRRALTGVPGAQLVRRPIFVPRERGVLMAEMLSGKENRNAGSYNREDCRRWADHHGIPFRYPPPEVFAQRAARWARSPWHREELPARAYYAADAGSRDALDGALFAAAWVEGLDVNEPETILWAAERAGLDGNTLLAATTADDTGAEVRAALDDFDAHVCPGVPSIVVGRERFFGKDRVEWAVGAWQQHRQGSARA